MRQKQPSSRSAFCLPKGRKKAKRRYRKMRLKLKAREKKQLEGLMSKGRESVRVLKRAQVLQALSKGKSPEQVAEEVVGVGRTAARDIGRRYIDGGLDRALWDAPRPGKERALKPKQEQQLVAMLCGPSPQGRARWTIRLATEEVIGQGIVATIGRETVRKTMQRHALKPWREKNVVHPQVDEGVRGKDGRRTQSLREAS